jgi:2-deoxy-D-gluconate 3-dehydrogenase
MDLEVGGRVAIVTGASRGLGRAIAEGFAAEGMFVLASARTSEDLESLVATAPESIRAVRVDMRDERAVEGLADRALEEFGRIDVLVNNAGIAPATSFLESTSAHWNEVLAVNLLGPVALTREVGGWFVANGGGKVVNVASLSGLRGKSHLAAYGASKGALLRVTEVLAAEWAPFNIQVNAIAPGAFDTEAQSAVVADADLLRRRVRKIPARRMGAPEEIVPLACYLASPLSDFVTGSVFVIDGGEYSKL